MQIYRFLTLFLLSLALGTAHAADEVPEGERVVILGDSNAWLGGDDCSQDTGWS